MDQYTTKIGAALAEPFPDHQVEWKQDPTGFRYAVVQAHHYMVRLDTVVGPGNWTTKYTLISVVNPAVVECTLTVLGVSHSDVGYGHGGNEPLKIAYTDAFRRAARWHGVGRHLYDMKPPRNGAEGGPQPPEPTGWSPPIRTAQTDTPAPPPWAPPPGNGASAIYTLNPPSEATRAPRPVLPATEPQIKAIFAIARGAQAMNESEVEARCIEVYGVTPSGLTRRQASEFIDLLKSGG